MLGQRLSNEQSNVGPTKYVAVGPTLNQRLGFGWRMVSVLAGIHGSHTWQLFVYTKGTELAIKRSRNWYSISIFNRMIMTHSPRTENMKRRE